MRQSFVLIFALLFSVLWSASAQSDEESIQLPNVQPYTPVLTLNEEPEICAAYEKSWQDIYKSEKPLAALWVDIVETYSEASHIYPEETGEKPPHSRSGYPFDYDGDGTDEILYVETHQIGNFPRTVIYLYNSQADFDSENPGYYLDDKSKPRPRFRSGQQEKETLAKKLATYQVWGVSYIFQIKGKLYTQARKNGGLPKATLEELRPDHPPKSICEIGLTPGPKRITRTSITDEVETGQHAVATALNSIYGKSDRGRNCQFRSRWQPPHPSKYWNTLNHRPQSLQDGIRGDAIVGRKIDESPEADRTREFRYLIWGLSDPTSFEVIRDLKAAYPKFIAEYSLYYQIYFDMDEAEATATAERGYRYLLGKFINARSFDNLSTHYFLSDEPITHNSSLEDIVKQIVDAAVNKDFPTDENIKPLGNAQAEAARQYYSALKLGLLASEDGDQLRILSDRLMDLAEGPLNTYFLKPSGSTSERKQQIANAFLLYSLKHPALMRDYLKLGADAERSTNYFGKTPLMYAAQNDNLESVDLLLANGANPNSATQHNGDPCKRMLFRDSRTPLMYAAENASPTLIYTLIEAGADTSAKDTEDNSVEWYLERNTALTARQKENIQQRLK